MNSKNLQITKSNKNQKNQKYLPPNFIKTKNSFN